MDKNLRQLERATRLGSQDALAKLRAAMARIEAPFEYPRFHFGDYGISIEPVGTKTCGHYEVHRRGRMLSTSRCRHKHKNRDMAKKCAIRTIKKIIRESNGARTAAQ